MTWHPAHLRRARREVTAHIPGAGEARSTIPATGDPSSATCRSSASRTVGVPSPPPMAPAANS
ncbi:MULTISPECIES: hypothetical protein [unclassified Streptomyces]|uniref:hypothetical protein n=1 Tax=unclassified Streptomyces TaxID=2593676 RepID=UPI00380C063D